MIHNGKQTKILVRVMSALEDSLNIDAVVNFS